MKRFALATIVLALISGFLLKGTFGHWVFVLGVGMCLGVPLALVLALWLLIALKRTGRVPDGLKATFLSSTIVGSSLLVSLGVGAAIHYWEIREARGYVAKIVPLLEAYQEKHGVYPETLADLSAPRPPNLLRDSNSYSAGADHFRFEYWDTAGMMDGYCFDSSNRRWEYFD